ncbi:MAG: hypothetical protein IPK62_03185 [Bacteroidetes bacterium]|nr:hypothetical protein [Bacteroidota bacterium]
MQDYRVMLYERDTPKSVKKYLEKSIKLISPIDKHSKDGDGKSRTIAAYLPANLCKYKMFYIRDILAHREKQKIRNKYFERSIDHATSILENEGNINELLGVLLHEPHLISIIKVFFEEVYIKIRRFLFEEIGFSSSECYRGLIDTSPSNILFLSQFFYRDFENGSKVVSDFFYTDNFIEALVKYANRIDSYSIDNNFDNDEYHHCISVVAYIIWKEIRELEHYSNKVYQRSSNEELPDGDVTLLEHFLSDESRLRHIITTLEGIKDDIILKIESKVMIYDLLLSVVSLDIYFAPLSPKRASDGIKDILLKNSLVGNNHHNISGDLWALYDKIGFFVYDESIIAHWENYIYKDLLRLLTYLKFLAKYIKVSDTDLYNELFSIYSIESLCDDMQRIQTEKISDKLFYSDLQVKIGKVNDYYFVNNDKFKKEILFKEICIKRKWDAIVNKMTNMKENGIPISPRLKYDQVGELLVVSHEFIVDHILFKELERNLNTYAAEILYEVGYNLDNSPYLLIENIKNQTVNRFSSLHGVENWKEYLKDYSIEVNISNKDIYIAEFIFNNPYS